MTLNLWSFLSKSWVENVPKSLKIRRFLDITFIICNQYPPNFLYKVRGHISPLPQIIGILSATEIGVLKFSPFVSIQGLPRPFLRVVHFHWPLYVHTLKSCIQWFDIIYVLVRECINWIFWSILSENHIWQPEWHQSAPFSYQDSIKKDQG